VFRNTEPLELDLRLTGRVERQNFGFDSCIVFLDGQIVLLAQGTGEHLGCTMLPVDETATVTVQPGSHTLTVDCNSLDELYHVGLFFRLDCPALAPSLDCSPCGRIVEWVRSSKKSRWYLHKDLATPTPGRYVFAPLLTPHLDRPHHWGSRDWISDERHVDEENPALGEWGGAYKWDNGNQAGHWPSNIPHVTDECLSDGEAHNTGLPGVVINGFPSACYVVPPRGPQPTSRIVSTGIAEVFRLHYLADPGAKAALQAVTGSPDTVIEYPAVTGIVPGGLIQVTAETIWVLIDGTQDTLTAAFQAAATLLPPSNFGDFATFSAWMAGSIIWHDRIFAAGGIAAMQVNAYGHSLGGAVACVLVARYAIAQLDRFQNLVTFGGPVPGDHRLVLALGGAEQRHWINRGDPVGAYASLLGLLFPMLWIPLPGLDGAWGAWQQLPVRSQITGEGVVSEVSGPWADLDQIVSITSDLVSHVTVIAPLDHAIQEYQRRLSLGLEG